MSECILCDGKLGAPVFPYGTRWRGMRFDYRRCRSCRSKIIDPLPSPEQLDAMYSHDRYHAEHYADLDAEITSTKLEQMNSRLQPGSRMLDFGCGTGHFLRLAKRLGFDAAGVELDAKTRAVAASNSGCPVHSLEEIEAAASRFDVIHLGDVLEHLTEPGAMLRRLERLLAPGGLFFIEGPIEDNPSLVFLCSRVFGTYKSLLGRNLFADSPPTHLSRTSARRQRRFFERDMGYAVRSFSVYETGWPYLVAGDHDDRPSSLGRTVRTSIGRTAVWAASATAPLKLRLGNRFAALVSPQTA